MRYRWQQGFWAFLLMRISGVAITLYLILHIHVLSSLQDGPKAFDELMATVQSPLFKFLELALLGGVIYHALNGVRIIWVDFGSGALTQKAWFWAAVSVGVVVFIIGAIPILRMISG
ncbi:MAG: succinate dehydrogenase, cytochrome b556 subunit [Deltaproteobacteria bacterium]|nr:succinate dehydrogenase, cytochrome b556 subunit [Deltaproteobacteria bacterium]